MASFNLPIDDYPGAWCSGGFLEETMRSITLVAAIILSTGQMAEITVGGGSLHKPIAQPYSKAAGKPATVKSPNGNIVTGIKNPAVMKDKK